LRRLPRAPTRITAGELTRRLENAGYTVTKRTVERDLQALSTQFPIELDGRSKPYGWSWQRDAPSFDLPGMTPLQAAVLLTADTHLRSLLPAHQLKALRPYMDQAKRTMLAMSTDDTPPWPERVAIAPERQQLLPPKVNDEVMVAVHEAIYRARQLEITYHNRGADRNNAWSVHPLGLISRGVVTYVACRIGQYEDVRLLALHRIVSATMLDCKAIAPRGFRLADKVKEVASGFDEGKPIRLVVRMDKYAAEHLWETPLSTDQTIEPSADEDWVTVTATVEHTAQLHWWLMGYGSNVEVLAPKALRRDIREDLEDALEPYKKRKATR
jgi:predicted DNA-binding transcriptional regulator YafY